MEKNHKKKTITPAQERFCADIVITGYKPVPDSAKKLLESVKAKNKKL